MAIRHKQQAIVPDQIDPDKVSAPAWNDDHEITGPWLAALAQFVPGGELRVGFGLTTNAVDGEPGGYNIYLDPQVGELNAAPKNYMVIGNVVGAGEYRFIEGELLGEETNEIRLQVLKKDANGDWIGVDDADLVKITVQVYLGVSEPIVPES